MKYPVAIVFLSAALFFSSSDVVSSEEQCHNRVGPVESGKNCPCVSVDAKCTIADTRREYKGILGKKCSRLNVEKDENGDYPEVDVTYSFSMCNENKHHILLNDKSKFFDWQRAAGAKRASMKDPRLPLANTLLESGSCIETDYTFALPAGVRYNVAAHLEGRFVDDIGNLIYKGENAPYCYAYTYEPINIKRGLCKMTTGVSCKTSDSDQSCQDFVDEHPECVDFNAAFRWEACNLEDRYMEIKSKASNVNLGKKVDGITSFENIGSVKDIPKGECESFQETRSYNTCSYEKVFYGINVQGTNEKGKFWHECQSYSFENLIFNPTPAPTISNAPSLSFNPSLSLSPSEKPTNYPTTSPTSAPSINLTDQPSRIESQSPTSEDFA